jgi:hypothetical protein
MSQKDTITLDDIRKLVESEGSKINELESLIRAYKAIEEYGWMRQREVTEGEYATDLPVPRLQIETVHTRPNSTRCRYDLIMRHHLGHQIAIPLGFTMTSGQYNIEKPLRGTMHMRTDAERLRLPAFHIGADGTVEREEGAGLDAMTKVEELRQRLKEWKGHSGGLAENFVADDETLAKVRAALYAWLFMDKLT